MVLTGYTVINQFDVNVTYDIHIRPQYQKILESLKKGQKMRPQDFIKSHIGQFGSTKTKK